MWTTLAMTAALAFAPAQEGLTLTHVRPTHGLFGPTRKDADDLKVLAGEVLLIAFDIEGLKVAKDGSGEVEYSVGMEVINNKDEKVLFKKEPEELKAANLLGTSRQPAFASVEIGTDTPPGEYTLTATVTDRAGKTSKKISRKFEVLPKAFGLVRLQLTYPAQTPPGPPAPPMGVPGQTLLVYFAAIGFERDKKTKQPNVVASMRILENGKPTLEKDTTGAVNKFAEEQSVMPLTFVLPLTRSGKFKVELKILDKLTDKTSTQSFDLTVHEK
ncbi:MAG: hypothetical protein HYS12_15770 [Planctomycetes bacterium]|nr:hypothetical protein [Planctomycetota bacterium]